MFVLFFNMTRRFQVVDPKGTTHWQTARPGPKGRRARPEPKTVEHRDLQFVTELEMRFRSRIVHKEVTYR